MKKGKKQLLRDFLFGCMVASALAPAVIGAVFDCHWPFWIGYLMYLVILAWVCKPEDDLEPEEREFQHFDLKKGGRR